MKYQDFLCSCGVYTTIDYPGADGTVAFGMNNLGKIVGEYFTSTINSGFLYDVQTQTFSAINFSRGITSPTAINDAGTIVGVIERNNAQVIVGFQQTGGVYRRILPQGFADSHATAITSAGAILGCAYVTNTSPCSNFLLTGEKYRSFQVPVPSAIAYGLNDLNTIVGTYVLSGSNEFQGFSYHNQTFTEISFPQSVGTFAVSVNNSGEIAGYFTDKNFATHGFTWVP
jgi:hypothetical protein